MVRGWAEKQAGRQLSAQEIVRTLMAGERSGRPSSQLSALLMLRQRGSVMDRSVEASLEDLTRGCQRTVSGKAALKQEVDAGFKMNEHHERN